MNNTFAIVMAGGSGIRLWPLSRRHRPKQFLDLTGEGTLLRMTVSRLRHLFVLERILVATVPEHVPLVYESLPELPPDNLIVEPIKRGTGPCSGLAALRLEKNSPNATMLVVPSDHVIQDTAQYLCAISTACELANHSSSLITIGLEPQWAAVNYGYIQKGVPFPNQKQYPNVFRANRFVEKPGPDLAKRFYESGEYVWNTGTFAWSVKSLNSALKQVSPKLSSGLDAIRSRLSAGAADADIRDLYAQLPDISIDYALLEYAEDVLVVQGAYQRIDAGDLQGLAHLLPVDENQNAGHGTWKSLHSSRNVVYTSGPLVVLIGVHDTIVVATEDVILVCAKNQTRDVRALLQSLDASMQTQYL